MEIFVVFYVGLVIGVLLYGVFWFAKIIQGNHYTYVESYDEEGRETETVVDWSDQQTYNVKKDK